MPESPPGFELLRPLGGGGMGDVYLARECPSGRSVALKFLKHPEHSTAHLRFVTELQALAELNHPNIVGVFASDFMRAVPFFTMEYAAGGSLSDAVRARRPSPEEAVHIIRVVARAVAAAHAKGTIHRDLKPSNVLLFGGPQEWTALKVADFGLAKKLDAEDSVGLTGTIETLGTPGYMPPEQVSRANGEIDRRADVYGLGATFYHVLTGRAPFVGETRSDVIQQVLADSPTRVRALRPEVPLRLEAIVLKCLAKDPADRYESVDAFLAEIDAYEAGLRITAPSMTWVRRAMLWGAQNRRRLAGAVALVIVLMGSFLLGRALGWGQIAVAHPKSFPAPVPPIPDSPAPPVPRLPRAELEHEDVVRALRGGERVELFGPKGPRVPVARGLGLCELVPADDGRSFGIRSNGCSVLQLLPDPGIDRYRLRVELSQDLRHEASVALSSTSLVGVAFGHRRFAAPGNQTVHALVAASFWEAPAGVSGGGALQLTDHGVVEHAFKAPWVSSHLFPGRLPLTVSDQKRPPRVMEIDVTPGGIVLRHGGRSLSFEAAAVYRGRREMERNIDAKAGVTAPVSLGDWSPRQPIGIWVENSWTTVLSFSIAPLP